jgi:hypothetical protein
MDVIRRSSSLSSSGELTLPPRTQPANDGSGSIGGFDVQQAQPDRTSPRDNAGPGRPTAATPLKQRAWTGHRAHGTVQVQRTTPRMPGGNVQQGGPQPGVNANQPQAPQPTGHTVAASKAAIKAFQNQGKPDTQHGVSDSGQLLDWATLEKAKGRSMGGKTATGIRKNLEAFKEAAQAGVSGSPIRRAHDVAVLKGHLDGALTLLDKHIGHHTKGEKAMVDLKAQLTTYKALLDRIGTDGPAPGTKPSYIDMLKTRAFGMPDSALAQIDTHGRQGVKDLGHLGSGAVNSTRLVHYQGEAAPMVFKPMHAVSNGASGMEALAGIDLNDPRFANRNVATSLAASHLDLDHMVPRTQYAAMGDQVGIAMEKLGGFGVGARDPHPIPLSDADKRYVEQAEAGLASGKRYGIKYEPRNFLYDLSTQNITIKADGTYGKEVFAAHQLDTGHPAFLEQVNDAEWLHALTGEMDPNAGNMRVELQRGPTGTVSQQLKLFDFDFSFGSAVQDPTVTHSGNNRTTLPPLVSERTLGAFANLAQNWAQAKQEYAKHLSPPELSAMETRLFGGSYTDASGNVHQAKGIFGQLRDLAAAGRVVQDFSTWRGDDPPGSGNQVDATTLMRADARANNGYLDRIELLAQDGRAERAKVGL